MSWLMGFAQREPVSAVAAVIGTVALVAVWTMHLANEVDEAARLAACEVQEAR